MDMKSLQDNWKVIVLSGLGLVGVGFGAGRLTAERPKTITTDVKTEIVKHEETKVDSKVAEKKVVEVDKGAVKTTTKTKTVTKDGTTSETETIVEEAPTKVVYRLFQGVYPTLNAGFDPSAGKVKVGVGIIVTF